MQRIFSAIGQIFGKYILMIGLISLLSLSGMFVFAKQPAFAISDKPLNPPSQAEESIDRAYTMRQGAGMREENRQKAYEEATEAAKDSTKGAEEVYEENLKDYKQANPEEFSPLEGAKNLVKKATGQE